MRCVCHFGREPRAGKHNCVDKRWCGTAVLPRMSRSLCRCASCATASGGLLIGSILLSCVDLAPIRVAAGEHRIAVYLTQANEKGCMWLQSGRSRDQTILSATLTAVRVDYWCGRGRHAIRSERSRFLQVRCGPFESIDWCKVRQHRSSRSPPHCHQSHHHLHATAVYP